MGIAYVSSRPAAVRTALVEAALCALGLQRVAGRVVGLRGAGGGGLSGGERKRVSLGVVLVTAPPVLLCDEPTSGLDAFGAHSLAAVLSAVAELAQRTVLLSVHQPSSQVFALLDHLTLLADGRALYRGAAADVAGFLSRAAVPVTLTPTLIPTLTLTLTPTLTLTLTLTLTGRRSWHGGAREKP